MWEHEVSIDIAAPTEEVFRYLSDFSRHSEWSYGVAELEPVTNGHVAVGSEFAARETAPFKLASRAQVVALDPPQRIAWDAADGKVMKVAWEFELTPKDGGTRLVERCRWQPQNVLGRLILGTVRKRQIPKENRQSLERIKTILEGGNA